MFFDRKQHGSRERSGQERKMGKFGRLLLSSAVLGITAATAYYYMEESAKAKKEAGEGAAEPDTTEMLKTAANRTYTTIKNGTAEAYSKVKEAIGPQGEEVLDVVEETAGKVATS